MAVAAVICAACGAKVRGDRVKCLRCGEPLVARQAPAPSRPIPWTNIGVVAGCLTLAGAGIMLTGGSAQSSTPPPAASGLLKPAVLNAVETTGIRSTTTDAPQYIPNPASIAATDLLAAEKAYEAGNAEGALSRLQAAASANPEDPRALNDLGQVLVRAGRAKEATPYLDKAVQLKPDSWTFQFNRARAYAQLQQWGQAVEGYRAAAQLFPDDYPTQYNLAKALQASGNLGAAIVGFEKAIQLAPGQADFQLSYGLALEAAKRPQDAAAAYKRYLELEPESPEAEKVRAHLADLQPAASSSGSK